MQKEGKLNELDRNIEEIVKINLKLLKMILKQKQKKLVHY